MNCNTDVVIVGGGPAGAATAIALRNAGARCIVMDDGCKGGFKPGESLAPNAGFALRQLGLESLLQAGAHASYTGNKVIWGNALEQSRYFFNEPYGNGWHLDRRLFEQQLKEEAIRRGAVWMEGLRFYGTVEGEHKIWVNGDMETHFLVDCSGRAAVVARKMGVRRQMLDQLTAYYFILEQPVQAFTGISFIEAVADGWWYAAPLDEGRIYVNFMSDSDLQSVQTHLLREWLFEKLQAAPELSAYLQIHTAEQLTCVGIKAAATSFLTQAPRSNWLAAGDALCTYDPLTSFGVATALAAGYHAATAIINGDIGAYLSGQQAVFNQSLRMLQHQYRLERRWVDEPFWRRRH